MSRSFPDLLIAFEEAVEALKVKLSSDENASTTYNGEEIISIVGDVEARYSALKALFAANGGAGLVGTNSGITVQEKFNALVAELDALKSTLGAGLIGTSNGSDVQAELDALSANQQSGVIVFQTYALLDAYTPANSTEEKGSFKVVNDPDPSLNGYYSWVSGTAYTKDADLVLNEVDAANTSEAVSGSAVYDHVKTTEDSIPNALNQAGVYENLCGVNYIESRNASYSGLAGLPSEPYSQYLKSLGIKLSSKVQDDIIYYPAEGSRNLANKYVAYGAVMPIAENDEALDQPLEVRLLTWKSGAIGDSYKTSGSDLKVVPIGGGFALFYSVQLLDATNDDITGMRVSWLKPYGTPFTYADTEIVTPFLSASDTMPKSSELIIFPQVSRLELDRIREVTLGSVLEDQIKALTMDSYEYWAGFATEQYKGFTLDVPALLDYAENGACLDIPAGVDGGNKYISFTLGTGIEDHYYYATYYTWGENGHVLNQDLLFWKNHGFVGEIAEDVEVRKTLLPNNVTKIEAIGKFSNAVSTDELGIMVGASFGNPTTQRILIFNVLGASSAEKFEMGSLTPLVHFPKAESVKGAHLKQLEQAGQTSSQWSGKKICWIGHSIPATSGHPELVATMLGATVQNKCIGGTVPALSATKLYDAYHLGRSRCLDAEKMAEWYDADIGLEVVSTTDFTLSPGSGVYLTQEMVDNAYGAGYEHSMLGEGTIDSDLYVIEYGQNSGGYDNVGHDVTPTDNTTFGGAYRFLIEKVTAAKLARGEKANFLIVTQNNSVSDGLKLKNDYQRTMGEYFSINVASPDQVLGIWNSDILTDWIPDGVHPELNSKVSYQIARVVADEILKIQPTDDIS